MQTFTGEQMLQIDIANCFGKDQLTWLERILWTEIHEDVLEKMAPIAADKLLYMKAVYAYREARKGNSIGHNMFLDATASGLQIMAALSGCKKTAQHVNLINTGSREDVYIEVANKMNQLLPTAEHVSRDGSKGTSIKKPVMTHYYNKMRQDTLSEPQQEAFYSVLSESFEGAEAVKNVINSYWNADALYHQWTLPNGRVVRVLVTDMTTARIQVDELKGVTFSYRFETNQPSFINSSLCPNIIHSIDAYIVEEMIERAKVLGFELAHIFDCFTTHPNHMSKVTQLYREILAEIADSNLLANILSEISGTKVILTKFSNDLSKDILNSEYALS